MFQSLIGTIKTWARARNIYSSLEFQSLIGTIKTCNSQNETFYRHTVSIPYRHDKNRISRFDQEYLRIAVSIPYRHDKNQLNFEMLWRDIQCVSIPYRHDKNAKFCRDWCNLFYKFQSLIGTIKTNLFKSKSNWTNKFQSLIGTIKTWPQ